MKQSIEWHKNCLKNRKDYHERLRGEFEKTVARLHEQLKIQEHEISILSAQIIGAEKQNKDGFDSDRFMKKKVKK